MAEYKRILLIEDDMDDQLFFKMAIADIDPKADCLTAQHGADGYKKLMSMQEPPDIIFLDLNMPVMNGFEFLKRIREESTLIDLPVIIFSTSNDESDITHCQKLGASGYLQKPNDNEDLVDKLKEILSVDFGKPQHHFVF